MTKTTEQLAEFAASTQLSDISPAVLDWGVDLLLDTVASALAGFHGDETALIRTMAETAGGTGTSTVIGGAPISPVGACYLNGYQITAVTICDVYKASLCHVTPEVLPPALAIAEREHSSGADLLTALLVGCEVTMRIGLGLGYQEFRARGWHSPGVIGPFGGSAAAGRLLGFDQTKMRHAFGLAGSQSAGTFAGWGTPQIKFHQSAGSGSGLVAALLAAEGFLSSADILEHPDGGLFNTHSDGGHADRAVEDLGQRWVAEELTLRRWPLASGFQSLVAASLALTTKADLRADQIKQVRVTLPTEIYEMYADFEWQQKFQSHLSPRFVAAIVLLDGKCWLDQFEPERRLDPAVGEFARTKIVLSADSAANGDGAVVEVEMEDGTLYREACETPPGDPANRLPRDEIIAKFHDARRGIIDDDGVAGELIAGLLGIAAADDVSPLIQLMGRPT